MGWTGHGGLRQRRRPLDVLPASWSGCDSESEQVLMMLMMSFLFDRLRFCFDVDDVFFVADIAIAIVRMI